MQLQIIEATLTSPNLIQNWRDTLEEWTDASEKQCATVFNWTIALRDQFVEAAHDIEEPETLDMVLAVRFIELKSHWILLNTQINYKLSSKGETDMNLAYRASLVSQLLEALEPLIEPEEIERIMEFLLETLPRARRSEPLSGRSTRSPSRPTCWPSTPLSKRHGLCSRGR